MAKSWALITRILVVGILLAFTSSLAQASTRKTAQYPLPFKPKWVTRLKKGKVFKYRRNEFSSPKVYKGLIFLGTNSSRFYAINKKNGSKQWRFDTEGSVDSAVAFHEDVVYFGDTKGVLYALDVQTGKLLWKFEDAGSEILSAPTIFDETLYFTTVESRLVALNIKTGNVDWEKQYPLPLSSKFSIRGHGQPVVSGGRIHVGFSDGVFRVFSVKKKSLIWEYKLTEGKGPFYDVDMEPLVTEEGSIYIASYQGELVSLSKSGKLIWKNEIGSGVNLKLNGDILYASSTDGNVYALGKNKGTIIWETKLNTGNLTAPALHNSTLVVGTSEKLIYFINATNGDIMARRFAKKGVSTNPLISDGRLYYLSNGGLLYCLKLT